MIDSFAYDSITVGHLHMFLKHLGGVFFGILQPLSTLRIAEHHSAPDHLSPRPYQERYSVKFLM